MKKIAYGIILAVVVFLYGLFVGRYQVFPYQQLSDVKRVFSEHVFDILDEAKSNGSSELEEKDTFLSRLYVQTIPLLEYDGFGGGITYTEGILYLVSNKGRIFSYDIDNYREIENEIHDVPMNINSLLAAEFTERNNFRTIWVRVNGVFSEETSEGRHMLYISHNAYNEDENCITHNVSKLSMNVENQSIVPAGEWETIFSAQPCIDPEPENFSGAMYSGHISGGEIVSFNEDKLLVSIGDYNHNGINGTEAFALNSEIPYGKTLLMDKNTGEWEIFTSGNRNLTGIYIDEHSTIWAVENGPDGGDELNKLEKGASYGWPESSYGYWYQPEKELASDSLHGMHTGYRPPLFSWVPSVAPAGVIKIEGESFPHWRGDLLVGMMRDRSLVRLRLEGDQRVAYSERIGLSHRVRDIDQLPSGLILILTDEQQLIVLADGGLPFEQPGENEATTQQALSRFTDMFHGSSELREQNAALIYERHCASCHNLDETTLVGPHLGNLNGRRIGSIKDFNYSQVLQSSEKVWNHKTLKSYLMDPEDEFGGTRMPRVPLTEAEVDSLLNYLLE